MKYIEPIKSVILLLLITLSATLTFSIWTYTPKYPTIEPAPTVDVSIAEEKEIKDIIKPYKLLFHFNEGLRGTFNEEEIDKVIQSIKEWSILDLTLEDTRFTDKKLDQLLREKNQFTLFFNGEVPLRVYDKVLGTGDSNFPEVTFDRLIVEWTPSDLLLKVNFISKEMGLRYSGEVRISDYQRFHRSLILNARAYAEFTEVSSSDTSFIAVPKNPVELVRNTYYEDGITPSRFRDALFTDPNAVRRGQVTSSREEFQDDHAIMRIDNIMKTLNFVYPVAESKESAIPSELLKNTIDFVNEHGGWTDEYRFTYMKPSSRSVKFQLFVHGLPVHSTITSTEIEQTWGGDRIFRYVRPYYTLDLTLPSETRVVMLPSGVEVVETIMKSSLVELSDIQEITLGYSMKFDTEHNTEQRLFVLEPSWFYLLNGKWIPYSPEQLGGELIGLE